MPNHIAPGTRLQETDEMHGAQRRRQAEGDDVDSTLNEKPELIRDPIKGNSSAPRHDNVSLEQHDSRLDKATVKNEDALSRSLGTVTRQELLDTNQFHAAHAGVDEEDTARIKTEQEQMQGRRIAEHPFEPPIDGLSKESFHHTENFADRGDITRKINGRDTSAKVDSDKDALFGTDSPEPGKHALDD